VRRDPPIFLTFGSTKGDVLDQSGRSILPASVELPLRSWTSCFAFWPNLEPSPIVPIPHGIGRNLTDGAGLSLGTPVSARRRR
jgi:hypothetical protein